MYLLDRLFVVFIGEQVYYTRDIYDCVLYGSIYTCALAFSQCGQSQFGIKFLDGTIKFIMYETNTCTCSQGFHFALENVALIHMKSRSLVID